MLERLQEIISFFKTLKTFIKTHSFLFFSSSSPDKRKKKKHVSGIDGYKYTMTNCSDLRSNFNIDKQKLQRFLERIIHRFT